MVAAAGYHCHLFVCQRFHLEGGVPEEEGEEDEEGRMGRMWEDGENRD